MEMPSFPAGTAILNIKCRAQPGKLIDDVTPWLVSGMKLISIIGNTKTVSAQRKPLSPSRQRSYLDMLISCIVGEIAEFESCAALPRLHA